MDIRIYTIASTSYGAWYAWTKETFGGGWSVFLKWNMNHYPRIQAWRFDPLPKGTNYMGLMPVNGKLIKTQDVWKWKFQCKWRQSFEKTRKHQGILRGLPHTKSLSPPGLPWSNRPWSHLDLARNAGGLWPENGIAMRWRQQKFNNWVYSRFA